MTETEANDAYAALHDNLAQQQMGLVDFVTQLYSGIGANLDQQQKLLDKVTKQLTGKLQRNLAGQDQQLDQVIYPIRLGITNDIAEQGIQLAAAVASSAVDARTRPLTALPVRPLSVPTGPLASSATAAARPPAPLAQAATGLADQILADTTESLSSSGESSSSEAPPDAGDQASSEEGTVTNVVALRSCDLQALIKAIQNPSYEPYLDAARGLLAGQEEQLATFFGNEFAAIAGATDPDQIADATEALLNQLEAGTPLQVSLLGSS